jgi:hypothetical protein
MSKRNGDEEELNIAPPDKVTLSVMTLLHDL